MLVYFAHPIDQAKLPGIPGDAIAALNDAGVSVFQPAGAFTLSEPAPSDMLIVDQINTAALSVADALLAWLPPGVPTLGVPREIEDALFMNKPVVILTEETLARTSVQMANWANRGATVVGWMEFQAALQGGATMARQAIIDALRTEPYVPAWTDEETQMPPAAPLYPDLPVKLDGAASAPSRAHETDAGIDLTVIEQHQIPPGGYTQIRTGVRASVPAGYWGLIIGRSSAWAKLRIEVKLGVIDSGYTGELMVAVVNHNTEWITVEPGQRLAQYVLLPAWMGQVTQVDELPEHPRGENGWGSTGQ
jgi:dUTP pyrophosphatase